MTPSPNSTSTISRCGASLLGGRDKPGAGAMRSRLASLAPVRPASTGSNASITMASMWEELPARQRPALLAAAGRALHVALHAAQHGARWEWGIRDLEQAVDRLPLGVWEQAAALAARLEATRAFAAGLSLLPGGDELRMRLGISDEKTIE